MMGKRYKVIISDRAKQMLGAHLHFLAKVNKPAAVKLKNRLLENIRSLQQMPERYPFFQEDYFPVNQYHKMFVENWYLVLYQIRDSTVYVELIVDCREDYSWLLR